MDEEPSPVLTQRPFPNVSELQVRVDGVKATRFHRDAVDVAARESTRLVNVQRQFRDGVGATQVELPEEKSSLSSGATTRRASQFFRHGSLLTDGSVDSVRTVQTAASPCPKKSSSQLVLTQRFTDTST